MKYVTYLPSDVLKPYVASLAISEADSANTYVVEPGTGPVIGFQYKGRLKMMEDDSPVPLTTSGITGMHDQFRVFHHDEPIGSVLVYFRPGGAAVFFKAPIHELFRQSLSLDNFMMRSELLILEERLLSANTDRARIERIEGFLTAQMRENNTDELVSAALAAIQKSNGAIRIKDLSAALHISQSPFEKRFRQVVGISARKFASIIRLKYAIGHYSRGTSLTKLSYDAGFYDQSHFIKEFRNFTGQSPHQYFSSPDANE